MSQQIAYVRFEWRQKKTRRSVEHCTPHADDALAEWTWLVAKYYSCIFMVKFLKNYLESKIQQKHQQCDEMLSTFMKITRVNKLKNTIIN